MTGCASRGVSTESFSHSNADASTEISPEVKKNGLTKNCGVKPSRHKTASQSNDIAHRISDVVVVADSRPRSSME